MKPGIKDKIDHLLKSAKLRRTGPRVAILSVMLRSKGPLTRVQIAENLTLKVPDKVTIYRALQCFVKAGFIHKAYLEARKWHFELADRCTGRRCHPHFVCKSCGRTRCLPEVSSPTVKITRKGFVVHRQQIRLEGLCPACSTNSEKIS